MRIVVNMLVIIERIAAEKPHSSPLNSEPVPKAKDPLSAGDDATISMSNSFEPPMHASLVSIRPVTGYYLYQQCPHLNYRGDRT